MSIKAITSKTKLVIQSLQTQPAVAALGSLPTSGEVRPTVPEVVTQGDSYFSRDSVGSAAFDSRMDFPESSNTSETLRLAANLTGIAAALSPQRPVAIAVLDLLAVPGGGEKATKTISETLEIADFESKLMLDDYQYFMNSLENDAASSSKYKSLSDLTTSRLDSTADASESIQRLSAASEQFSRNLDIRLSWENVQEKISQYYASLSTRFGTAEANSDLLDMNVNRATTTGTAIVQKIEKKISSLSDNNITSSSAYESIVDKVSAQDLLSDLGNVDGYSTLLPLEKVAACCEFLSRAFIDTFSGDNGSVYVNLPTQYSGSSIFEPFDLVDSALSSNRIPSHYNIIAPAVSNLSSTTIESFKSSVATAYSDSYGSSKTKSGLGFEAEAGVPLDLYTRLFKSVAASFESSVAAKQSSFVSNTAELYDSVLLLYSMKSTNSNAAFNGFIRGILLTNILDESFLLGTDSTDEYDTITETKSEIDDSVDGKRTVTTKTSTKSLSTESVDASGAIYKSIFSNAERLKNFPQESKKYTSTILTKMDEAASSTSSGTSEDNAPWHIPLWFSFLPTGASTTSKDFLSAYVRYQADTNDEWSKNSPRCQNEDPTLSPLSPTAESSSNPSDSNEIVNGLVSALQLFSRDNTGKTIANAIKDFYDDVVSVFEKATGKTFKDVSPTETFLVAGKTCTKRAIIDVIIECFGNIVGVFLTPGIVTTDQVIAYAITRGAAATSTGTYESEDAVAYVEDPSEDAVVYVEDPSS